MRFAKNNYDFKNLISILEGNTFALKIDADTYAIFTA